MDEEEILRNVENKIRSIPGVVDMKYLDEDLREKVASVERQTEENGAVGGLMPFVNKGVWETLKREKCLVVVLGSHETPFVVPDHAIYLLDQKGQIVGEFLNEDRRKEMRRRDDVYFLSEDFVLYHGLEISGEPFFLVPEIEFHEIDDVEGVTSVISASISTPCDHLIRSSMGHMTRKVWTHLIGFDIARNSKAE
ncbi:MAG: hypothetical protein LUQ27_04725 [Methanomassiliicoccales archaeon]|nr:hypothetical protein [Methanomassiliicoccales archaeon]